MYIIYIHVDFQRSDLIRAAPWESGIQCEKDSKLVQRASVLATTTIVTRLAFPVQQIQTTWKLTEHLNQGNSSHFGRSILFSVADQD